MIEEFNMIRVLGGFNHNQTREVLQGFKYDTMDYIGGERGGRRK